MKVTARKSKTVSFCVSLFLFLCASSAFGQGSPIQSIIVPEESQISEIQQTVDALNFFIANFRLEVQEDKESSQSQFASLESSFASANAASNAQSAAVVENAQRLSEHETELKKINKTLKRLERRLSALGKSVRSR